MKIDLYGLWSRILSPGCPMRRILRGETQRRLLIDFQSRPLAETSLKNRDAQKAFIAKNLLNQRIKLLEVREDGMDGMEYQTILFHCLLFQFSQPTLNNVGFVFGHLICRFLNTVGESKGYKMIYREIFQLSCVSTLISCINALQIPTWVRKDYGVGRWWVRITAFSQLFT